MYLINRVFILLLPVFFHKNTEALLDLHLISDYFHLKMKHCLTVFSCNTKIEHMHLVQYLWNTQGIYSTIYDTEQLKYNLKQIIYTQHSHFGVVLNGKCKNSNSILEEAGKYQMFNEKYHWLIFAPDTKVLEILSNITINVNAEITIALPRVDGIWKLLDVYNPGFNHGGTLKVTHMGFWNETDGFQINQVMSEWKYWRRKNMSEVTFTGTVVLTNKFYGELEDYLYLNDENRSVDTMNRFQFSLWVYVKQFYSFNLKINFRNLWGKPLANGSFVGLIGALQRKEVDIGLSCVFVKYERVPAVDFLTQTFIMRPCFIFRQPKAPIDLQGAFFNPLSRTVWYCTWGVLFFICILLWIIWKQEMKLSNKTEEYNEYNLSSYIGLTVLGELCQQDIQRIPDLYSGRIATYTLILFTYILYQFYSDSIVSSLLMEAPIVIHDLKDLVNSSLRIGIEDIAYERDYFDQTTDPLAIDLYNFRVANKKNGTDAFYEPEFGLELVKQGAFAFQVDTDTAYPIIARTFPNNVICELGEVNLFPPQKTVGIIQQDSPFRELFTYCFQRLTESGIMLRQRFHWHASKPECIKIIDGSKINVGLDEFWPALLFLVIGIIISLIILCVELIIKYRQRTIRFKFLP